MFQHQNAHRYLKEQDVADITGMSLSKLRNDRCSGVGIPYCKVGRSVRYRIEDVREFMDRHLIATRPAY